MAAAFTPTPLTSAELRSLAADSIALIAISRGQALALADALEAGEGARLILARIARERAIGIHIAAPPSGVPATACRECKGAGCFQDGPGAADGTENYVDCEHCNGTCECHCTDCAEAARAVFARDQK